MKTLLLFLALCFVIPLKGEKVIKQYTPHQSMVLPVLSKSRVYGLISYADRLLAKEDFVFTSNEGKAKKSLRERPVILACMDESTYFWYVVHVYLPYPVPKDYLVKLRNAKSLAERESIHIPLRVLTKGYTVEHIKGAAVARLSVRVYKTVGSTKIPLTVYRIKYADFTETDNLNFKNVRSHTRSVNYTPIYDKFIDRENAEDGREFLKSHIIAACDSLKKFGVKSSSTKGKLISDIFPAEMIMSLMVSEQWDPLYFLKDTNKSLISILSEYALNRENAFAWSVSKAKALGCLQFTNMRGNGTYSNVVRAYKSAHLVKSFDAGSRDMHNVIKAAICLLDFDLANSKKSVDLLNKNSAAAAVYPVAAYNGGRFAGHQMLTEIENLNGKSFDTINPVKLKIPSKIKSASKKKGVHNTETPMYISKYFYLMSEFNSYQTY